MSAMTSPWNLACAAMVSDVVPKFLIFIAIIFFCFMFLSGQVYTCFIHIR